MILKNAELRNGVLVAKQQSNPPQRPQSRASKPPQPQKEQAPTSLGRLSSFGLSSINQVPFLLPNGWDDLSKVLKNFSEDQDVIDGESYVVIGKLNGTPSMRFKGTPRLVGYLQDEQGNRIGFARFGDSRELQESLEHDTDRVVLYGQMKRFNGLLWLQNVERIKPAAVGKLRPQYPGKTRVINPETVRDRVLGSLRQNIPQAAHWLANELSLFGDETRLAELAGCPSWSFKNLIYEAHMPQSLESGQQAQKGMEFLAGMGIIQKGMESRCGGRPTPLQLGDWRKRASEIPFSLTQEQQQAIDEAVNDMRHIDRSMHRILSGDVGTGKTAVYGAACATCADAGGRVVVLLPNEILAKQICDDFMCWWPDIPAQLVTGSTGKLNLEAQIYIGTTALLFRLPENYKPNLVVVDEQQKFAREQREQLVSSGSHLMEVSATCIPRSQALAKYGVVKVSKLTKCHIQKNIITKAWDKTNAKGLFAGVRDTIKAGQQVLVVYPQKEESDPSNNANTTQPPLQTVETAFPNWDKLFPGRVRYVHGDMSTLEKNQAIQDMLEGNADILLSTTVVEVGVTIPKLYRGIVVHPERFGLSTLHQLRGRVARKGGVGYFDLYMPNEVSIKALQRVDVLVKTQDGFEVSEYDMKLRGVGDLSQTSERQSGADETFLFGRPVSVEILDSILSRFKF